MIIISNKKKNRDPLGTEFVLADCFFLPCSVHICDIDLIDLVFVRCGIWYVKAELCYYFWSCLKD